MGALTGLRERLEPRTLCKFAAWLEEADPDDAREIREALRPPRVSTRALYQDLSQHIEVPFGRTVLAEHRNGTCACRAR